MAPDNSDEDLSTWLSSALRTDLGSSQVDVDALLTGSRRRAQRLRSQRIGALAVAAALVIGVPAGLEVFRPSSGVGPPAVMLPSESPPIARATNPPPDRSVTLPTPVQLPTLRPSGSPTSAALDTGFAFTAAELPAGLLLNSGFSSAELPIVEGRTCSSLTTVSTNLDAGPLAGRRWIWITGSGKSPRLSVNLIVTRWAPGAAAIALTQLIEGAGPCGWSEPQTAHRFTAAGTDQSWSSGSHRSGRAVVRVGDWIAGVEVQDSAGSAPALALAQKLALSQVERLAGAGR